MISLKYGNLILIYHTLGEIWTSNQADILTALNHCLVPSVIGTVTAVSLNYGEGGNRGVKLPSPYFLSQFLPPPYFFEPISPSSLLFPPISPFSQLCLGHFSLLPILFHPPLWKPCAHLLTQYSRTLKICTLLLCFFFFRNTVRDAGLTMYQSFLLGTDTEKCPLSVITRVRNTRAG